MSLLYGKLTLDEFAQLDPDKLILELHGRTYKITDFHKTNQGVNYQATEHEEEKSEKQLIPGIDNSLVPKEFIMYKDYEAEIKRKMSTDPPVKEYPPSKPIKTPIRIWARQNGWPNLKGGFIPKAAREAYIKEFGEDDPFDQ